jgi:hypothetical protein
MKMGWWVAIAGIWMMAFAARARGADVEPLLASLRAVGPNGAGHSEAARAWAELVRADVAQLPEILKGLDGANPLAANWIRAAVDAIAERQVDGGRPLPVAELEHFVLNRSRDPRARRLAYEWLLRVDPSAADRLIPGMLDDPGWEFRRDAVARLIQEASRHAEAKRPAEAVAVYRQALNAARERDQVDLIAQRLRGLGEKVDLARQLGYVMRWKIIGPFDDVGGKGFDAVYPPEREIRFDAQYPGKTGTVGWKDYVCRDDYGTVDLNQGLVELKQAAGYAAAEFLADQERKVLFRLASDNAVKVWLNGSLVASYKIYHAGTQPDQYQDPAVLRPGRNLILIKVCQNELTQDWARAWDFRLRIVDLDGTPVLSADESRK